MVFLSLGDDTGVRCSNVLRRKVTCGDVCGIGVIPSTTKFFATPNLEDDNDDNDDRERKLDFGVSWCVVI